MAKGTIGQLHPPGNNGTKNGSAFIDGDDGSFNVASTPRDNNSQVLTVGGTVTYTLSANGKHIESLTPEHVGPPSEV